MIIVFNADTDKMGEATELFKFDDHTPEAILDECLESWCNEDTRIIKNTAFWYKANVINGEDRFGI